MTGDRILLSGLVKSAGPAFDLRGTSIETHCDSLVKAYRKAWRCPGEEGLFRQVALLTQRLFDALDEAELLRRGEHAASQRAGASLLTAVHQDFGPVRDLCVRNKRGAGEGLLMYALMVVARDLYLDEPVLNDDLLLSDVGDIVYLRGEGFGERNQTPFSMELRGRYRAARFMAAIDRLGLLTSPPAGEGGNGHVAKGLDDILNGVDVPTGRYIPTPLRPAFELLEVAFALYAFTHEEAVNRIPRSSLSGETLLTRLRRSCRHLQKAADVDDVWRQRLYRFAAAVLVRSMSRVDNKVGQQVYAFLRRGKYSPRMRHSDMFQTVPGKEQRIELLNFLFRNGQVKEPAYFVRRFKDHFKEGHLRFKGGERSFVWDGPVANERTWGRSFLAAIESAGINLTGNGNGNGASTASE